MSKRLRDEKKESSDSSSSEKHLFGQDVEDLIPTHYSDNSGFTFIEGGSLGLGLTHPLTGRKIFLCSQDMATVIAEQFEIPDANIVRLNAKKLITKGANVGKEGKDEILPDSYPDNPDACLKTFKSMLAPIHPDRLEERGDSKPIIIHCHAGMCRTPTAAIIYLVNIGKNFDDAKATVVAAMKQRDSEYNTLDSRDYRFPAVLDRVQYPDRYSRPTVSGSSALLSSAPVVASSPREAPIPSVSSSPSLGSLPVPTHGPFGSPPEPSRSDVFSPGLISPAGRGRGRGRSVIRESDIIDQQKSGELFARSRSEPSRTFSDRHMSSATEAKQTRTSSKDLKRSFDDGAEEKSTSAASQRGGGGGSRDASVNPRSGQESPRDKKSGDESPPTTPRL